MAAEIIETYKDDKGRDVWIYANGMHKRADGPIVKPPAPEYRGINKGNAAEMNRRRIEKTKRALALAILEKSKEIAGEYKIPLDSPAAAVGVVGGVLWGEIVQNPKAPARDRLQAWETLGKHAGVLGDLRLKEDPSPGASLQLDGETARYIIDRLMEARKSGDQGG